MEYLNSGGNIQAVRSVLSLDQEDLDGDTIPEIIIDGDTVTTVIGCRDGKYANWLDLIADPDSFAPSLVSAQDMNLDGLPESVFMSKGGSGWSRHYTIWIYEWYAGYPKQLLYVDDFRNVVVQVADIDGDGVQELIVQGNNTANPDDLVLGGPFRDEIYIYKWNGDSFISEPVQYAAPQYRFQALQDTDRFSVQGQYDKALEYYQNVIFSGSLDWWSPEKKEQIYRDHLYTWNGQELVYPPTSTPLPENRSEYFELASYTYYRMVALHVYLGEMDAAQIQYNTLQQKFPADSPGHPYVEMATAFWDAYQSSGNMTTACGAAIKYAAEHPEILIPLGSDYHGWQSHIYVPADVCPFR
jgi:hypothetical protein